MQAIDDDLVSAMLLASRALVAVAARTLASTPHDVTLPQFRALVVLATRGPQSAGALAEELAIGPSSVTRLCDRLVRKGLIERDHASADRRQVELRVTPEGRQLIDEVTEARRLELVRLVATIPEGRRALAAEALEALGRAAGEIPEQAWSAGWGE